MKAKFYSLFLAFLFNFSFPLYASHSCDSNSLAQWKDYDQTSNIFNQLEENYHLKKDTWQAWFGLRYEFQTGFKPIKIYERQYFIVAHTRSSLVLGTKTNYHVFKFEGDFLEFLKDEDREKYLLETNLSAEQLDEFMKRQNYADV